MDPNQFFYFTNVDGSQSAAFPNFMAENIGSSSSPSAWPSSSSANRRQPRPSQQPETSQPKRQRTEAAGQRQSFRTGAPGWQPQYPSDQNPPFTTQNNTDAETGERPFLYQFQAKLTRIYLSEREYQAAVSRMKDFNDKPTLVQIMESMAEKMVQVDDVLAPRRELNLFPTKPPSFQPAAEDRGESRQ